MSKCLIRNIWVLWPETQTKRQATQHGCLPSLLGYGDKEIGIEGGEKYFVPGSLEQPRLEQKSLVPAHIAQLANQGRTPFFCTLWVPIHLSFNSQQWPPLSSLSVFDNINTVIGHVHIYDKLKISVLTIWGLMWMRSSRVVAASDKWLPMPKSQQTWARFQHTQTQWNRRGGRYSSVE